MGETADQKDLMLCCVVNYEWPQIRNFALSLEEVGFAGDKTMIAFGMSRETCDELRSREWSIASYNVKQINVMTDRHLFYYKYLTEKCDRSAYRIVFSMDVRDVVFQTNPSTHFNNLGGIVLVGSEGLTFEHEAWGRQNMQGCFPHLWPYMKNKEIHNCGVWAGGQHAFAQIAQLVYHMSIGTGQPIPDQAALNVLLHSHKVEGLKGATADKSWSINMGTTSDPEHDYSEHHMYDPPIWGDQGFVFRGHTGEQYCVVHQYDRVPGLRELINARYAPDYSKGVKPDVLEK